MKRRGWLATPIIYLRIPILLVLSNVGYHPKYELKANLNNKVEKNEACK